MSVGIAIWTAVGVVWEPSEAAARQLVQRAVWSWFAVDSTFSVVAGAPMNAALNLAFLVMILVPLARVRRRSVTA